MVPCPQNHCNGYMVHDAELRIDILICRVCTCTSKKAMVLPSCQFPKNMVLPLAPFKKNKSDSILNMLK